MAPCRCPHSWGRRWRGDDNDSSTRGLDGKTTTRTGRRPLTTCAGTIGLLAAGLLTLSLSTAQGQTMSSPTPPASSTSPVTPRATLPAISVREAHERAKAGDVVLVDIRTPEEWADTGVPSDAIRLDMREAAFEAKLAGLRAANPGKEIALICRTANRTARVQDILAARGWTGLINVKGGLLGNPTDKGWLDEGLPVAQPK